MGLEQQEKIEKNPIDTSWDKKKLLQANEKTADNILGKTRDRINTKINPKNWWVEDYTDKKDFNSAYSSARKAGEKEFMWNNKRYSTNYQGTPEQQLRETGIVDERIGMQGSLEKRAYISIKPSLYDNKFIKGNINNFINNRNRFDNAEYSKLSKELQEADKNNDSEKVKRILEKLENFDNDLFGEDDNYSEDGWRLYLGMSQKNNTFSVSKYTPAREKTKNTIYYSLQNSFKDELFDLYTTWDIKEGVNSEFSFDRGWLGQDKSRARVLGNFTINVGKDTKGEYISYYDIYDLSPTIPIIGKVKLEKIIGKPFEIYDRIYFKDYGNGIKKRMYYSDNELKSLDMNSKSFDTLALQRELSNRGYELKNSKKSDGEFDGILGEETKNALLDRQKKH